MEKAVVLLSGGQDSTTCLLWAIKKWGEGNVIAVGFDYGQRHAIELKQANIIATILRTPYKIFDIKGLLSGSSLTDHSLNINHPHPINNDLPSSFTAGRNALFLTIAASYAHGLNICDIVTGVCQTDYSGYPDCRHEFIVSQEKTLSLAVDRKFSIHTPLMYLTKAQTWKLAADLGIDFPFSLQWDEGGMDTVDLIRFFTMTDYYGDTTLNDWGMGREDNPASIIRANGFLEAVSKGWI